MSGFYETILNRIGRGLTDVDLADIERRLEWATDGPWSWAYEWVESADDASYVVKGPGDRTVDVGYEEDAVFIAHAREDVAVLVAEVRRLASLVETGRDD